MLADPEGYKSSQPTAADLESLKVAMVYHFGENNGVTALVTGATWRDIEVFLKYASTERGRLLMPGGSTVPGPIFTFSDDPKVGEFVTGSMELCERLTNYLQDQNYFLRREDLYVPFSNGYEKGIAGEHVKKVELTYRTTEAEFAAAFPFPGFTAPSR